jgi:murein DD-endopeptidase MepM/ murein hydrolase activator NlpD
MRRTRQWASALLLLVAVGVFDVTPVAAADPSREGEWVWPSTGRITQRFGCTGAWTNGRSGRCSHFHNGLDIADRAGTPIYAARAGLVTYVGYNPWESGDRAWIVMVDHGDGLTTWYAHLQPERVYGARAGDWVQAGELIGYMGNTGRSTGVHLHLMVERRGRFLDPRQFLPGGPPPSDAAARDPLTTDSPGIGRAGATLSTPANRRVQYDWIPTHIIRQVWLD